MADPALYNAILEDNRNIQSTIQDAQLAAALAALDSEPWNSSNYGLIPLIENPTGCLCVYDTSGNFRCGASCTWTVPAGTTKVQFQLWGPGAPSQGARCCGGSPFGAVGAFASVIIDAVPGCSYTLCAGCAICCYSCYDQGATGSGGTSYVTGYDLTSFCAEGGFARISCAQCVLHGSASCCRWQAEGRTSSGPCICGSGRWYCYDNSCATCGEIPWLSFGGCKTYYGSSNSGTVYGLPSYFSSKTCLDRNNYGYHVHPPVIDVCHSSHGCCCQSFDSGTCGGCCCSATQGYRQIPGAGGTAVHVMGGNYRCGDAGRMGMVRVTWC